MAGKKDDELSAGYESIHSTINLKKSNIDESHGSFFESITNSMRKPETRCKIPYDPHKNIDGISSKVKEMMKHQHNTSTIRRQFQSQLSNKYYTKR